MENSSIREFTCNDCQEVTKVDWSKVRPDIDDGTSNIGITFDNGKYIYVGECDNCGNLVEIEPPVPELKVTNVEVDKEGMYIEITDTVTNRSCWIEAWKDKSGDWEWDYNQYIFHLDDDNDVIAKMFQEDLGNYAEEVDYYVMSTINDHEDEYNKLQENKALTMRDRLKEAKDKMKSKTTLDTNVKKWMLKEYPEEKDYIVDMPEDLTFKDILDRMLNGEDIYEIIQTNDSTDREYVFNGLTEATGYDYDYFYYLWLNGPENEEYLKYKKENNLSGNKKVKTESINDNLTNYFVALKRAIEAKGFNVNENINDDNLLSLHTYYGNAGMGVNIYSGDNNGTYDFTEDTVGLGGDTEDEVTVLPIYENGWEYETATPLNTKPEVGSEVYAMFKSVNSVTPDKVADIIEKSFSGILNESKEVKTEAKFKDKVKAIKKSLKKNDKRLSDKTAEKSAEKIAGSMIKTESVNWDYYDKFDNIMKKYLPKEGEGDTLATQIVTAITKLVYKWYNDGDVYDNVNSGLTGWGNDLSDYANWLYKYIDGTQEILETIQDCYGNSDYEKILKRLADSFLTEEYLEQANKANKEGSIYDCEGPFEFNENWEDDYYEESKEVKTEANAKQKLKDIDTVNKEIKKEKVNTLNEIKKVTESEEDVEDYGPYYVKEFNAGGTDMNTIGFGTEGEAIRYAEEELKKHPDWEYAVYETETDECLYVYSSKDESKKVKTEDIETNNSGGFYKDNKYYLGDPNAEYDEVEYGEDEIDNLWTAACCGDNKYLQNYYNNGGEPNIRHIGFGGDKVSLIIGALNNKCWDTVELLKNNGETILKKELPQYKRLMAEYNYEDEITKSAREESLLKNRRSKKVIESKTSDMDEVSIIMELEGGELTIADVDDWNKVKEIAEKFRTSQGFYGRLLRNMLESEEEFGGVENLPFPITM